MNKRNFILKQYHCVQFSSVAQSCPTLCDPMDSSTPGFPVLHHSQSLIKLMSIESVRPPNHLILCHPLLLPPSMFPSIRVFSIESVLPIRWPKHWSFSISPSNEYSGLISFRRDWLDLLAVRLSSVFSNTTVQEHQFFSALLGDYFHDIEKNCPWPPASKESCYDSDELSEHSRSSRCTNHNLWPMATYGVGSWTQMHECPIPFLLYSGGPKILELDESILSVFHTSVVVFSGCLFREEGARSSSSVPIFHP